MGYNKEAVTGHLGVHKGELIAAHDFLIIRGSKRSYPLNEPEESVGF